LDLGFKVGVIFFGGGSFWGDCSVHLPGILLEFSPLVFGPGFFLLFVAQKVTKRLVAIMRPGF
jgi:hypothetical protein